MNQPLQLCLRRLLLAIQLTTLTLVSLGLHAQTWPDKAVHLILTFPPAGVTDIAARLVAERMSLALKQPIVVDPRGGSGGNVGADLVAKARPDGYTIGITTDTLFTINPLIYNKMPFDPAKDLVAIATLASFAQVLVCHPSVPAKNVQELLSLAKQRNLTYASGGVGVPGHLAMELLLFRSGASMTHVPYRGAVPATTDILGHQVDCGFLPGPTVLPHVSSGKLVALAVSSAKRTPIAPQVPTVSESGFNGFDASFKLILFAPANTPPAILELLTQEAQAAVSNPEVAAKLRSNDLLPIGVGAEATRKLLLEDAQTWTPVVRKIDLKAE
jgi:tripartite-type tricarboxylate transporter receptor subunit TctC